MLQKTLCSPKAQLRPGDWTMQRRLIQLTRQPGVHLLLESTQACTRQRLGLTLNRRALPLRFQMLRLRLRLGHLRRHKRVLQQRRLQQKLPLPPGRMQPQS